MDNTGHSCSFYAHDLQPPFWETRIFLFFIFSSFYVILLKISFVCAILMAAEDICKDYASSLEDLTFNSKPLINMLTMLAEENRQLAAEIVKLIEKRIYEV